MNKLLIIALIGAAAYFAFFQSPFKKDFHFNGTEYSHVKELSRGEIHNHFYTPNGEEMEYAQKFVQILEISDKIQKSQWPTVLKPLISRYKLTPFNDEESVFTGSAEISGIIFDSFAAPVKVKDNEHLIIFVSTANDEEDTDSMFNQEDILNEMKGLESIFN